MGVSETVAGIVAPVLDGLGVELVDVEHRGAVVRVVVDESGGIGLDRLGEVTQQVSRALDDADPIAGRYTLEVSSPGVERPLRTPRHFAAVVGQTVTFRRLLEVGAERVTGILLAAGDDGVSLRVEPSRAGATAETIEVPYRAIDRARTVFEWGPAPKPGKGSKPGAAKASARKTPARAAAATAADGEAPGTAAPS
jgi:ribosome maturation factor RimP